MDGDNDEKIGSLLSSFCDIQTIRYDAVNNLHYVTGFAQSIDAIPKSGCLKLKYQTPNEVLLKSFSVKFEAYLLDDWQANTNVEDDESESHVDSDVLMEAYKEQDRLEHIAGGEEASTSGSTSISTGMSIESDRSFKLYRHG